MTEITEELLKQRGWSAHTLESFNGKNITTHLCHPEVGLQYQVGSERVAITQTHLGGLTVEELEVIADILERRRLR